MEGRKSSFDIQLYLHQQAPVLIHYLEEIADKYSNICEVFETPEKRLFFKSYPNENLTEINEVFNKQELIDDFKNRLLYWRPILTEISIESARQLIRDYYFTPIKNHSLWQPFLNRQKTLLTPKYKNEMTLNIRMKALEIQLAGALSFRIISAFNNKNPEKLVEEANLLSKIINVPTPANALIVNFEEELKKLTSAELSFTLVPNENTKELLMTALDKLRSKLLYQAIGESEHILWDTFETVLTKSDKSEKKCFKLKSIMANYLFDNSIDNDPSLIKKIEPYIDTPTKKKHAERFDKTNFKSISDNNLTRKRDAYRNKEGFFSSLAQIPPQRKLSAPPPVQKEPYNVTPRSEVSESELTPRAEAVSRMRPTARQLRRRASVVNIFSQNSGSEDVSSIIPRRQTPTPRQGNQ